MSKVLTCKVTCSLTPDEKQLLDKAVYQDNVGVYVNRSSASSWLRAVLIARLKELFPTEVYKLSRLKGVSAEACDHTDCGEGP